MATTSGYESLTHYPDSLDQLTIRGGKWLARLNGALVRKAAGL